MSTFLIGYDLDKPGQDYSNLISAIKSLGAWWHHLDSTWLVKSDLDHTAIRDKLQKHIDTSDKLIVINITGDARAWVGFNDAGSKWLKDNV